MPLRVFIKDLVIAGKHGVHEHEKESPQRFNVSVELKLAATKATIRIIWRTPPTGRA